MTLDYIQDVAVVGVPHEDWGQIVRDRSPQNCILGKALDNNTCTIGWRYCCQFTRRINPGRAASRLAIEDGSIQIASSVEDLSGNPSKCTCTDSVGNRARIALTFAPLETGDGKDSEKDSGI